MEQYFINISKPAWRQGFVRIPSKVRKFFPGEKTKVGLKLRGTKSIEQKTYQPTIGRIYGLKSWFREHKIKPTDKLILKILKPQEKFYLGLKRIKRGISREEASVLIGSYVENIPREILRKFRPWFEKWFRQEQGVYALYKGNNLYYVGMGRLPGRIVHHFRDRHKKKWDKFSAYIIRRERYTRELETIISRFARPMGTEAVGRLSKNNNLKYKITNLIRTQKKSNNKWLKQLGGR